MGQLPARYQRTQSLKDLSVSNYRPPFVLLQRKENQCRIIDCNKPPYKKGETIKKLKRTASLRTVKLHSWCVLLSLFMLCFVYYCVCLSFSSFAMAFSILKRRSFIFDWWVWKSLSYLSPLFYRTMYLCNVVCFREPIHNPFHLIRVSAE